MNDLNLIAKASRTTSIYIMVGKTGKCWFVGFGIPEVLAFQSGKMQMIDNFTRKFDTVQDAEKALSEYGLTAKGISKM